MPKKSTAAVLIVGRTVASADLLYATGFKAPDPIVFLQKGKAKYLVVSRMETGRAEKTVPEAVILTPERLRLRGRARRSVSGWAAALVRRVGVREVSVPRDFPLATARELERRRLRVRIAEAGLFPDRAVKAPKEIGSLRCVQAATCAAMNAAIGLIAAARVDRDGVLRIRRTVLTAEAVRLRINAVLLQRGCLGGEPIVACGRQAADPHDIGAGPLLAGRTIVIDIFPQHQESGYWGDLTRTVVKGHADAPVLRMYRAVRAAQRAALRTLRAGVRADRVHAAAARELERRGFLTDPHAEPPAGFIHSTGHGVGLEIHEAPWLAKGQGALRAGNVVTVEPGLYYPELGGVRIEDTVVVTRDGWAPLATCPQRLVLT